MNKNLPFLAGPVLIIFFSLAACFGPMYGDTWGVRESEQVHGALMPVPDPGQTIILQATGKGVPPNYAMSGGQAAVLAERAAIADAYRQLSEKIRGVYLQGYQQVNNLAVDYDQINVATQTWLRGAEVVSLEHGPDQVVKALVKIRIPVVPEAASASKHAPGDY